MAAPTSRLSAPDVISQLLDDGSWSSWDVAPSHDGVSDEYAAALAHAAERTGLTGAVVTGSGTIAGTAVAVIAGEFGFLAGSVGRAEADRLVAAITRATAERLPLVGLTCSGGTRMQEGTPAFVQMVRIGAAIAAHRAAGLPYLVHLRNPTTGGVMASWGSLGQVTLAEPGALTGFLGPRVYSALHGEEFPAGIQAAEHLAEVGVIDAVGSLDDLRFALGCVLRVLAPAADGAAERAEDPGASTATAVDAWQAVTQTRRAERPGVRELLETAAEGMFELSGTQAGEMDPSILLVLARIGGQPCVVVAQDRAAEAAGHKLGPAGLRVAQRGFALAAELRIPVVTVIDTRGAELSVAAEEGAMAGEIARCLSALVTCAAPTVSLMLGEGNGGGALALLPADRIVAAQHAWLAPLPPEGASAIVHRDTAHAAEMAQAQQITAHGLHSRGVVDRVIAETPSAADEPAAFCERVAAALAEELVTVSAAGPGSLEVRAARYAF